MSSQATVITPDGHPVTVNLPVPGKMMAVNAIAALAAAAQAGGRRTAAIALGSYRGIRGRLTVRGDAASGVLVLDSYAHHPTAIAADLEAARTLAGDGQVITVFQPCGYPAPSRGAGDGHRAQGSRHGGRARHPRQLGRPSPASPAA